MRVRELRIEYRPVEGSHSGRRRLSHPRDVAALARELIGNEAVEVFIAIYLDTKLNLVAYHTIGRGTLDICVVHPRDVFKGALLSNAAQIVTVHNHPSGDPSPSPEDLNLYLRLNRVQDVVGIPVVDNLIVAEARYWSESESRANTGDWR